MTGRGAGAGKRLEHEHEPGGARRHRHDVGNAQALGGLGLELAHQRPVGQNAALVRRRQPGRDPLQRWRWRGGRTAVPSGNAGGPPSTAGDVIRVSWSSGAAVRTPRRPRGPRRPRRATTAGPARTGPRRSRRRECAGAGAGARRPSTRWARPIRAAGRRRPARSAVGPRGRPAQRPNRQLGLVGEVEPHPRLGHPTREGIGRTHPVGQAAGGARVESRGEGELGDVAQGDESGHRHERQLGARHDQLLLERQHRNGPTVEVEKSGAAEQRRQVGAVRGARTRAGRPPPPAARHAGPARRRSPGAPPAGRGRRRGAPAPPARGRRARVARCAGRGAG